MSVVQLARNHARALLVLVTLLVGAGVLTGRGLPSSIYPPLEFPRAIVIGRVGTLPARSMVVTVTRPLEQACMEVPGIRRVRSKTFRGATEISAQFAPGTDMVVALQQLQNRVAEARTNFPAGAEVTVERLTPAAFPIYSLNLTGELPTADLRDLAYYVLRPALARAPGVGRVDVSASDTREIEVALDPTKLLAARLTVADVATALRSTNVLAPVGRYSASGLQHLVLASGSWAAVSDIGLTPVTTTSGSIVRVQELGTVVPGSPDRVGLVTGNGRDAAVISVSQQIGSSILAVKAGIEQALRDQIATLPSGLTITKVYDLAEFVADAMAGVRDAIVIGGLLAMLVLFAFLRDWRMTLVASLTLPVTAAITFLAMRLFGQSINLMSMGGLAVAIGLVIDDAVVVVENIHRNLGKGDDAIARATSELVAPVTAATLTTVVVFAPLSLLSGVVGQFFRALSMTLSVAVLTSLFLALAIIPLLAGFMRRGQPHRESMLDRAYATSLAPALRRPGLIVLAVVALAIAGGGLYARLGSGFLPQMDEGGFVIDYLTPAGSALEQSDRQVRQIETLLGTIPEVAAFSRRTGSELGMFATQQNKGDILVRLKPRSERSRSAAAIIADLRPRLHTLLPAVDIEFVQLLQDMLGDLEGAPTPVEVKIFGDDLATLEGMAATVEAELRQVAGVVDVVGMQRGNPELEWQVDAVAAGRAGITVDEVATQLSTAWLGSIATELRSLDRTVPVRVRLADGARLDPAQLGSMRLRGAGGVLVPLSAVARPVALDSQGAWLRENLRSMALVTARIEGRDLGSVVGDVRAVTGRLHLPVGYSVEIGGQYDAQRQAFSELLAVLGIACALVFLIMVIEFRAFTPALLIIASAPLSFAGGFGLLLATGTELNVSSAMGLILLVGLVVKNGIVLLDYAYRQHAAGVPWPAAVEQAAHTRLHPILMTTLCTLFGLLPLALGLGAGAELQKPLALAVIGGLGLSTPVALYAIPSVFLWLQSWKPPVLPRAVNASPSSS